MEPTPKERLGRSQAQELLMSIDTEEQGYDECIFTECLVELFARLEKLEVVEYHVTPDIHIGGDLFNFDKLGKLPKPEGHPIPDYDKINDNLTALWDAYEEADAEVDKLNESIFINSALEWLAHRGTWNGPMSENEQRAWGAKDFALYEIMKENSEVLT